MCSIERRRFQWLEQPLTRFSRSRYSLTLNILYGNSYYGRRIGNRTQAFEWYLLEWHPVTFSIMIIQREITWKWYNILQYLQWPTNRKSFMIYQTAPFSMTLNDPYKLTPFFDAEYLRNGTTYRHSVIEILIGTYTRPTQHCHFEWPWLSLSDLAKYSMTRSVARCLRQLSFLLEANVSAEPGGHTSCLIM